MSATAATDLTATTSGWRRRVCAALVVACVALYYAAFFLPPRMLGANDPDRYYHLGLSRLIAQQGLLRHLPQVEDLGWGRYFPDKEFLFHLLTGGAYRIAGGAGVLWLVPLLAIAIVFCLYDQLARLLRPWQAVLLALGIPLLTVHFAFRLMLLRPHLLAILFFCMLLLTVLRRRNWPAGLAAMGFALAYHAYYVVLLVAAIAFVFRGGGDRKANVWLWASGGLAIGIVVNPYFPSNLAMSWVHLQIALGIDVPPGAQAGVEIRPMSLGQYIAFFGFVPLCCAIAAMAICIRRFRPWSRDNGFWFLFALTSVLALWGVKSARAMEYAVPAAILLAGYAIRSIERKWGLPLVFALLLAVQGRTAWEYYDFFLKRQTGFVPVYVTAINSLPVEPVGAKVFNCQWDAGAYLLYLRPDLRFVDALDPALLWKRSHDLYAVRQQLDNGAIHDPYGALREVFHADYAICASPPLIAQMASDPAHFREIPVRGDADPIRLFALRPDAGAGAPASRR